MLVEWWDADIVFFEMSSRYYCCLAPIKKTQLFGAVFANSQQGNHALILQMKAVPIDLCLSQLQTAWLGKHSVTGEPERQPMSGCCFPGRCWVADRVLLTLFLHTMSLCGGPCAAVPGPLFLLLNFFHGIKRLFLFQSFSFSFTPEPLQLRHKRNLPAAAFVLAFQEAREQCESFLISLWTNEMVLQARSSGGKPTAQVVGKGGKASLIKAQQNQL